LSAKVSGAMTEGLSDMILGKLNLVQAGLLKPLTYYHQMLDKHLYLQKPLTHDIYEARILTEAAKKYKVVTQMGDQGASCDGMRTMREDRNISKKNSRLKRNYDGIGHFDGI